MNQRPQELQLAELLDRRAPSEQAKCLSAGRVARDALTPKELAERLQSPNDDSANRSTVLVPAG
jgi:hypothetical protein